MLPFFTVLCLRRSTHHKTHSQIVGVRPSYVVLPLPLFTRCVTKERTSLQIYGVFSFTICSKYSKIPFSFRILSLTGSFKSTFSIVCKTHISETSILLLSSFSIYASAVCRRIEKNELIILVSSLSRFYCINVPKTTYSSHSCFT